MKKTIMFYDATLSYNPFRTDCYLLLIFCCLTRIVRQSRAFFTESVSCWLLKAYVFCVPCWFHRRSYTRTEWLLLPCPEGGAWSHSHSKFFIWSRLDNLVVRWASTMLCVIVVWVCVEDPGSRTNNGFYEGNPLLFQVLLWTWKLLAQTASVVQPDGHDGSNLE